MSVLIVIPVFNEEAQLSATVGTLLNFLAASQPAQYQVVIAENGSTDATPQLADQLARENPQVRAVHLPLKGRGRALKAVWSESSADVLSYMDVDLSTDLAAFPRLIAALRSGEYDVATGSRLHPSAETRRCWKREFISRIYNAMVKFIFNTRFTDAQCGFKAITRPAALDLLPIIEDTGWFFDTELLVLAEKLGYRIFDLPVKWTEDRDSRVRIILTTWGQLRGMARLRRKLRSGGYAEQGAARRKRILEPGEAREVRL